MKKILLGIVIGAILLVGIRTMSGEDEWTCKDGKWVMHGKPASTHPTTPCITK